MQAKLPSAAAFVDWCKDGSPAGSPHGYHAGLVHPPKSLRSRLLLGKRDAIYQRHFHLVPAAGPQSIVRKYSECKLEGSARLHSFVDIGEPGRVLLRERSCHQCASCFAGKPSSECFDEKRFGLTRNVPIAHPRIPESSLSRALKSAGEKSPEEMAPELSAGMMLSVAAELSEHEPWNLGRLNGRVVQATQNDVIAMRELGYKNVRAGQRVLHLTKFEPFDTGSRKFIETKVALVVPLSALRRHKLENNAGKALHKPSKVKSTSARYGTETFELKDADLRAIVAIVTKDKNGGIGDFKVERLSDYRVVTQRGKQVDQWLVKWVGWDKEADMTWEPREHFADAAHLQQANELKASSAQRKADKEAVAVSAREQAAQALKAEQERAVKAKAVSKAAKAAKAKADKAEKSAAKREQRQAKAKAKTTAKSRASEETAAGGAHDAESSEDEDLNMRNVLQAQAAQEEALRRQQAEAEAQRRAVLEEERVHEKDEAERRQQAGAEAQRKASEPDGLQEQLSAKAASDIADEQKLQRIAAEVETLMDNGVCINPLLRGMYGTANAEAASETAAAVKRAAVAADNEAWRLSKTASCAMCLELLEGPSGSARAVGGWGKPKCCAYLFHYECLTQWLRMGTDCRTCPGCKGTLSLSSTRMLGPASEEQETAATAAVEAAAVAEAAAAQAVAAQAAAEAAAENAAGRAAEQAAEAQAAVAAMASVTGGSAEAEAVRKAALDATVHAEAAAEAARAAAATRPAAYDSVDEMLELADLESASVCGDGNCGYTAFIAAGSEHSIQHCRRGKRTTTPTAADYHAQQTLRDRCVDWLLLPAQKQMLDLQGIDSELVAKQRKGKVSAKGPVGVYPNGAALRAMAAVDEVHLVVVTTNTGPTVREPRHKHRQLGEAQPDRPFDRVAVYPPTGTALLHFKSWANDIVPVLLRCAMGDAKRTDPTYRVILHNGEPSDSRAAHFDATRLRG